MSDDKYRRESLTEEEARLRHPTAYFLAASIVDEEDPVALYWLAPTRFH
jgi:hypothetical protein